ncbi:hypothetical protein TcBrA4_0035430 [Trypanosoma cruzi]|nr:hypothetical protein TcBrA4_0035430 [Trypanosoma cruzi]
MYVSIRGSSLSLSLGDLRYGRMYRHSHCAEQRGVERLGGLIAASLPKVAWRLLRDLLEKFISFETRFGLSTYLSGNRFRGHWFTVTQLESGSLLYCD